MDVTTKIFQNNFLFVLMMVMIVECQGIWWYYNNDSSTSISQILDNSGGIRTESLPLQKPLARKPDGKKKVLVHHHHHQVSHPYQPHQIIIEDPDISTNKDVEEETVEVVEEPDPKNFNAERQILFHIVPPHSAYFRQKQNNGIPDLLAILAPLAAIPLLGSLAVSTFTTMVTLTGLGRRRRRKRDNAQELHQEVHSYLNESKIQSFDVSKPSDSKKFLINAFQPAQSNYSTDSSNKTTIPITELFQLDIVQQYLRQSGRPDYNDEIIASYLACRGMFALGNHCLERLACHYADMINGRLRPLERDVSALIIYSLLRNGHIDSSFKRRLQRAALFGYDHASSSNHHSRSFNYNNSQKSLNNDPSFVAVCDREFPCPKSQMP